jgi:hypothetical protein
MLTVGVNLVQNNAHLLAALPFIVATVLIAPPAALLVVLQTCTASCAKDTRLDERAQLARKHHRLRCVHPLDPLIALCGRSNPPSMRASFPRKQESTAASTPYP